MGKRKTNIKNSKTKTLMKHKNLILFVLMLFVIFLNFYLYFSRRESFVYISNIGSINITKENASFKESIILRNCTKDEDCSWIIINCCPENLGAKWECLNKESYIDCKSKLVLCANFSSPKPEENCKCIEGKCES